MLDGFEGYDRIERSRLEAHCIREHEAEALRSITGPRIVDSLVTNIDAGDSRRGETVF
jgi:hypothetical protein